MESIEFERLNEILGILKEKRIIYNDTDFCNKIGIAKSFLSEMKNGKKLISEQTVRKIADCFELNLNWVLTGKGKMQKEIVEEKNTKIPINITESDSLTKQFLNEIAEQRKLTQQAIAQNTELINIIKQMTIGIYNGQDRNI